ncbi:MAG: hypothetical protein ABJH63_04830 [Rhizobiaceae bacterium]
MPDLLLLAPVQMSTAEAFFPRSHGVPRIENRRVVSGIVYVCNTVSSGAMRRVNMARPKHSKTGFVTGR